VNRHRSDLDLEGVNDAPIREGRNDDPCDAVERRLEVERSAKRRRCLAQEAQGAFGIAGRRIALFADVRRRTSRD
jgi:hypothetical protein